MRALSIVGLIIWHLTLSDEVDQYDRCVRNFDILDDDDDDYILDDDDDDLGACSGSTACCEWRIWGTATGNGKDDWVATMNSVVVCLVLFVVWLLVSAAGASAGLLGAAAEAKARAPGGRRPGARGESGAVEMARLGGAAAATADATLRVRLPSNVRPGDTMSIVGPRGQPLTFVVPPGARGGQVLAIGVPPAPAPQLAQFAVVQEQPVVIAAAVVVVGPATDVPVVVAQLVHSPGPPTKFQQTSAWEQQQRRHTPPTQSQPRVVQGTVVRPGSSLDGPRGDSLDRAP